MKKIFPHVFVAFTFILMMTLGTWQVNRMEWKKELMAKVDARLNHAPITVADFTAIENDEFKSITVSGKFDHKHEIILLNKSLNGKAGYHVVTPLITTEGETIIINRGWVPSDKEPIRPETEQSFTGVIRDTQKLNFIGKLIIIPNTPEKNQWFWIDLPAMYKSLGVPNKGFYIERSEDGKPDTYPYGLPKEVKLYNEHLQYVITWYSLAVVLLVMYYFRFYRKSR